MKLDNQGKRLNKRAVCRHQNMWRAPLESTLKNMHIIRTLTRMFHSKDFPQTSVRTDNELIVSEMKKKDGVMDFVLEIKL